MEEVFTPATDRLSVSRISRYWAALLFLFSIFTSHAQTTNLLNLCTEGALQAAAAQGGIYTFGDCGTNVAPVIKLREPLVVERDLTLMSTQSVLLDGQKLTRIMVVKQGVRLNLQNIFFFSGRHTETNFNDGGIAETAGGGLYNNGGIVTIRDGRFEANSVLGVTGNAGTKAGEDGESGGDAAGGGIYNNGGQIILLNVVFIGNSVTGGIGGAGANGATFGGSGGRGGDGGSAGGPAIYSKNGSVMIFASTFTTNNATGSPAGAGGVGSGLTGFAGDPGKPGEGVGGAISGDNAEMVINSSTFFGNSVHSADGLAGNAGILSRSAQSGRDGGDASGGAIFSSGGHLSVTNSTFFANSAEGGNGGAGGAGGTTGFGGAGGDGGAGGSAVGGAIQSASGQAVIANCTFSDNLTTGGTGGAGGVGGGISSNGRTGDAGPTSGGAIYGGSGEVLIANNILANSKITVGGTVTDRGGNLSTDLNPLLTSSSSMRLVNPLLSGLASNGGHTQTMAIATNSPAINKGLGAFCPQLDQRGTNRLDSCDIGAYETSVRDIPASVLNGLTVAQQTNAVSIAWPAGYPNLYLQSTTNLLGSNTLWTTATQTTTNNGSSNILSVTTTNSAAPRTFFRLYGVTNVGSPFSGGRF